MRLSTKFMYLLGPLLFCAASNANAQVTPAIEVPLETRSGWGPVKTPAGYRALRIQGRSSAPPFVLAQLFGDFTSHSVIFPRVVQGVDILACDRSTLKARYRTTFDPKPGGKTLVESLPTVKVVASEDRIQFTWSSDAVKSSHINAAQGQALFITRQTPNGTETLIDYVSAVRPKNAIKGAMVGSQSAVLAADARYVIDRLIAAAEQHKGDAIAPLTSANFFHCPA
jgi:hypothetical protein